MQAVIDESEDQGAMLVLAGFIGRAEDWVDFADRWQAALDLPPSIPRFKFKEFVHGDGVFTRLSPEKRKKKVSDLVAAMAGGDLTRISVALELPTFRGSSIGRSELEMRHPYVFAFQLVLSQVAFTLLDRHQSEPFKIVFDEQRKFGPLAKKWYRPIRELCMPEEIQQLLPTDPTFEDDECFVALQAADLYAGLVRSGKGEKNAEREAPVSRLLAMLSGNEVTQEMEMRAQANFVASEWGSVVKAVGNERAPDFVPIAELLQKNLATIGGDSHSEQTLAPLFAAVDRVKAAGAVPTPYDSDGLGWLRRELAAVTALSARSRTLDRSILRTDDWEETKSKTLAAMEKYGITIDQMGGLAQLEDKIRAARNAPTTSEQMSRAIRAITLLDEDSLDGFRRKVLKRRENAAKRARR